MPRCVVLTALLLLCLCVGCGVYFKPSRDLSRRVEAEEIVGTWKLTAESYSLLKRDGSSLEPPLREFLLFDRDGGLGLATGGRAPQRVEDDALRGTWKLEHSVNANTNLRYNNVLWLQVAEQGGTYSRWLNIDEVDGRLRLWSYYGDPDLWEFMEYERIQ
jgi:hypothetical protein